ncbi:HpcH/HpaI aldolase/citrate lyase family protein [Cupriavidus sp. CuC1]|uniref:HpcH/HpaI aldolase/citrate lyase family protein n=1 Tax=Cupriavidus sp. CuC1 TaxID=3373131 RepID=UPI0037D8CC6F
MPSNRPASIKSLLFVPADSPRKLASSLRSGADALVYDLEDAVAETGKRSARTTLVEFLANNRETMGAYLCIRVNGLATRHILDDLRAVVPFAPDAIVLPKCRNAADVYRLSDYLAAFEHAYLDGKHRTEIIAMATETSEGIFGLASYREPPMRLRALMWGVDDLAAEIGAFSAHSGRELTSPFSVARTMCLLAAAQAGIDAIDAVSTVLGDEGHIDREAMLAKRDGFAAKAAGHPAHIPAINRVFAPGEDEVAWAKAVVDAFNTSGSAGVVRFGDCMIDKPHLRLAHRILCSVHGDD